MQFPDFFAPTRPVTAEKMAATPLVFSAVLLGALLWPGARARAQDAATLIQQMRAAEASVQYTGTLFIVRDGRHETARVFRNGPRRRWEWIAPAFKEGDLLVDDGNTLSLYHRSENSVTQTQSTPLLSRLGTDWQVSRQNANYLLRRGNRTLLLDGKRKILLRFENGDSVYSLQNVKFAPVAASNFVFQAPAGAKIVRSEGKLFVDIASARAAANWLKAPTQLPADYALESAIAAPNEVWLRYTNGQRRFSIFEQKAEAGSVALTKVEGGWFWKTGGVRYLVSGAPEGVVKSLATSLK